VCFQDDDVIVLELALKKNVCCWIAFWQKRLLFCHGKARYRPAVSGSALLVHEMNGIYDNPSFDMNTSLRDSLFLGSLLCLFRTAVGDYLSLKKMTTGISLSL